jgi:hypothetical protein
MMSRSTLLIFAAVVLVAIAASSSVGFLIGNYQTASFQSAIIPLDRNTTVTTTVTPGPLGSNSPGSVPVVPNPYEYSLIFQGTTQTWYVPVVFLGQGTTNQMYVNYDCDGPCPTSDSSISSMSIPSSLPKSTLIFANGETSQTNNLIFSYGSVVNQVGTSETILYDVSVRASGAGYYTFALPYGCTPGPVIYVKTPGSSFDYSPISNWLQILHIDGISCSDSIQVTILGITDSYYTDIPVEVNFTG